MLHALSIAGFFALLVALGAVLELTVRRHWAQITAALRGDPPRAR